MKKDTVICYCSVGYRSSGMAQKLSEQLEKEGIQGIEVYNLEGSIFKWANERHPLEDPLGNSTIFAHPYSALWGKFLNHNLRRWKFEPHL